MAGVRTDADKSDTLEREVCAQWQKFVADGHMEFEVGMTTVVARK